MPLYEFGSGDIFMLPNAGVIAANPTPIKAGTLQDISLDISYDTKELFGKNQFAVTSARGKGKISGKAKMGSINGKLINDLIFGTTLATGSNIGSIAEGHTVPASSVYTCTVTNSATFIDDLGVTYASGVNFIKVASGPTAGQYSVAAGIYTFAAADASASVLISYTYSSSSAGVSFTQTNQPMGLQPYFQLWLNQHYAFNNSNLLVKLYAAYFSKFSIATKNEDFTIPELDFMALADVNNNVIYMGTSE